MSNKVFPAEVTKYLSKYASDKWKLEWNYSPSITTVIVVPAIKEYENIQKLLTSLIKNDNTYFPETLVIFIINNLNSSGEDIKKDNARLLEFLRAIISKEHSNNELIKNVISSGLQVAVIDASSEGFEMPEKDGGVGYARKTGMDLALTAFDYSSNRKKIIVCLDADCIVQDNYITEVINNYNQRNLSSAVIYFEHDLMSGDDTAQAIICYEIFLRYYVLGMRFAGSHYAFHSIGSTITCDYESYIKAEGMNKRKAAEDFYFLEKIAKIVKIDFINSTTVFPSSRGSWRVPFGTGQRVNRFISKTKNEYLLYDPQSFVILKNWLTLFCSNDIYGPAEYMEKAGQIHPELFNFFKQQIFEEDWEKIQTNSKSAAQINKQKSKWFDGFRIMKLIHHLREAAFPEINMFEAVDSLLLLYELAPLKKTISRQIPPLNVQKEYLLFLRELDKRNSI